MTLKRGVTMIDQSEVDAIASDAEKEDAVVFWVDTNGASDGSCLFSAVRNVVPLDPPMHSSWNWDALTDSLWSGLDQCWYETIVIIWLGAGCLKTSAPRDYMIAVEMFTHVADTLADMHFTAGDTKMVCIYVCDW